jgi:hypothetical protein
MLSNPKEAQLAREAKAIVAPAFRNGPIENLHARKLCPACSTGPEYSRITDDDEGDREVCRRSQVRGYAYAGMTGGLTGGSLSLCARSVGLLLRK